MIKNIIFDFDGVIVDSEVLASKAFSKYFKLLGFNVKEEDFYDYSGIKTINVIDSLTKKYSIKDKKKFTSEIFKIISEVYVNDLKVVDGVDQFIYNSKKNHFIGSNSNKDRIIDGLKTVGLSRYFPQDKIYSFDMVQNPKPYPDIYLKVINDNSLNINETIIIEDSVVGVKAGNVAGIRVYGLTAGKHWHSTRDINELYNFGALDVFKSYINLEKAIKGL